MREKIHPFRHKLDSPDLFQYSHYHTFSLLHPLLVLRVPLELSRDYEHRRFKAFTSLRKSTLVPRIICSVCEFKKKLRVYIRGFYVRTENCTKMTFLWFVSKSEKKSLVKCHFVALSFVFLHKSQNKIVKLCV